MRQSLIDECVSPSAIADTRLRSAVGERESGVESGEKRLAERNRSATPAAEPQTEARRSCGTSRMPACDERAVCEVERAWSRGGQGRPAARGAKQNRALVTAASTNLVAVFLSLGSS